VDVDVDANAAPVSAVEEETEPRLILRPLWVRFSDQDLSQKEIGISTKLLEIAFYLKYLLVQVAAIRKSQRKDFELTSNAERDFQKYPRASS
jgi:hypothetical protein